MEKHFTTQQIPTHSCHKGSLSSLVRTSGCSFHQVRWCVIDLTIIIWLIFTHSRYLLNLMYILNFSLVQAKSVKDKMALGLIYLIQINQVWKCYRKLWQLYHLSGLDFSFFFFFSHQGHVTDFIVFRTILLK